MALQNSKLLLPEKLIFSVLDKALIPLFSGYVWQGEDLDTPLAKGSMFYAFEEPLEIAVASVTIVDVTDDKSEPDISSIEEEAVASVDRNLRAAIESEMEVINWMSSKLNVSTQNKGLVTPYITRSDGKEWQYIALRTSHFERKYVVVGSFDVEKSNPLAKLVFQAIGGVSFIDG